MCVRTRVQAVLRPIKCRRLLRQSVAVGRVKSRIYCPAPSKWVSAHLLWYAFLWYAEVGYRSYGLACKSCDANRGTGVGGPLWVEKGTGPADKGVLLPTLRPLGPRFSSTLFCPEFLKGPGNLSAGALWPSRWATTRGAPLQYPPRLPSFHVGLGGVPSQHGCATDALACHSGGELANLSLLRPSPKFGGAGLYGGTRFRTQDGSKTFLSIF